MRVQILCLLLFMLPLGHLTAQVQVGDGTNFSEIESDGTLEFNGTATVWDDYVVPFTSVKVRAAAIPPDFEKFQDDGASSTGVYGYAFDAIAIQEVFFTIQMPHSWAGTAIHPHIHWSPATSGTPTTGNVVWGMEYTWINYHPTTSLAFPATDTLLAVSEEVTSSTKALHHLITAFAVITPSSVTSTAQNGISSILVVRFYRDAAIGTDTYGADAFALSFDIHYERNTVGSRQEFIK